MSSSLLSLGVLPPAPNSSSISPPTLGIILAAVSVTVLVILGVFIVDRFICNKERGGLKASLGLDPMRKVSSGIRGVPTLVQFERWWEGLWAGLEAHGRKDRTRRGHGSGNRNRDEEKASSGGLKSEDGSNGTGYPPLGGAREPGYLKYKHPLRRPQRARLPLPESPRYHRHSNHHHHHSRHRRSHDLSRTTSSSSADSSRQQKPNSSSPFVPEDNADVEAQAFRKGVEKAFDFITSRNRPSIEPAAPLDFTKNLGLGPGLVLNSWSGGLAAPEPLPTNRHREQYHQNPFDNDPGALQEPEWFGGGRAAAGLAGRRAGDTIACGNADWRRGGWTGVGNSVPMPYVEGFKQQKEPMKRHASRGRGRKALVGGGARQQLGQVLGEIAEV
jgi:hypothetical protein